MNKEKMDSIKGYAKAIFNDVANMPFTFFKEGYKTEIERGETKEISRRKVIKVGSIVTLAAIMGGIATSSVGIALLIPYLITSSAAYGMTDKANRKNSDTKKLWPAVTAFREGPSGQDGPSPS